MEVHDVHPCRPRQQVDDIVCDVLRQQRATELHAGIHRRCLVVVALESDVGELRVHEAGGD
eukprot:13856354-Alexandrium_andersonii.AAC.1